MATLERRVVIFLPVILRFLLAIVFLTSAIGKVLSPDNFEAFVASSTWLSLFSARALMYVIVTAESVVAILLLYHKSGRVGSIASFVMLLLFTGVLVLSSHTSNGAHCGCFGELLGETSNDMSILRNIVFLLVSVGAINYTPMNNHQK
jgi:uncharacterized membrane protein YphA (DoxX/SURF4 family)